MQLDPKGVGDGLVIFICGDENVFLVLDSVEEFLGFLGVVKVGECLWIDDVGVCRSPRFYFDCSDVGGVLGGSGADHDCLKFFNPSLTLPRLGEGTMIIGRFHRGRCRWIR